MLNCLSLMGPIYLDLCSGWGLMGSIVCPVYFYLWIKGGSYQGRGPPTCPCPLLLLILSHIVPECCIPHISNQLSLPTCRPQEFIFFSSVYTIFFSDQATCRSYFPNQGLKQGPQQWKHRVLDHKEFPTGYYFKEYV